MGSGNQRGLQGLNSIGQDSDSMFSEYKALLPIRPCWYELPLGIYRSGDLSHKPDRSKEHAARDALVYIR